MIFSDATISMASKSKDPKAMEKTIVIQAKNALFIATNQGSD
jgi:hypothetical protein